MNLRKNGVVVWEMLALGLALMIVFFALGGWVQKQVALTNLTKVKGDLKKYAVALEAYATDRGDYPPSVSFQGFGPGGGPKLPPLPLTIERIESALTRLSTPVAYLSDALVEEPFNARMGWVLYRGWDVLNNNGPPPDRATRRTIYFYGRFAAPPGTEQIAVPVIQALLAGADMFVTTEEAFRMIAARWAVISPGPDGFYQFDAALSLTGGDVATAMFVQTGAIHLERFRLQYDPANGLMSGGDILRSWQPPLPTARPINAVDQWEAYQ